MSPQLVRLLTILLLVLIHLFLFRVIRAIWVGINPPVKLALVETDLSEMTGQRMFLSFEPLKR